MQEITEAEIATGEPVQSKTLTKVRENFDEVDNRVTNLEGGGNTVYPPIILSVNGTYGEPGDFDVALHGTGVLKTTLNFPIIITGVRLLIDKAGVSGTTEIDLKYKRGIGAYQSIFTTRPSVGYGEGDDSISTNAEVNSSYSTLQAGDILRLDVTAVQKRAVTLTVRIDYVKV